MLLLGRYFWGIGVGKLLFEPHTRKTQSLRPIASGKVDAILQETNFRMAAYIYRSQQIACVAGMADQASPIYSSEMAPPHVSSFV